MDDFQVAICETAQCHEAGEGSAVQVGLHVTSPAGFIQGRDGVSPNTNFHVVVPEGDRLVHYWRDNADGNLPWYFGGLVTRADPVDAASLAISEGLTAPSTYDLSLEVLSQERGASIYHLYRYPEAAGHRWFRGHCLRVTERDVGGIDRDPKHPRSEKVAQLTGQKDPQTIGTDLRRVRPWAAVPSRKWLKFGVV